MAEQKQARLGRRRTQEILARADSIREAQRAGMRLWSADVLVEAEQAFDELEPGRKSANEMVLDDD